MFDLAVIGGGPGGYVAALRAAQLGLKVCCIELHGLGGTCLFWGCIPSKTLLHTSELFEAMTHHAEWGIRVKEAAVDLPQMLANKRKVIAGLNQGVEALFAKYKIERIIGRGKVTGPNQISVEGGPTVQAKNILLATGSDPRALPNLPFDEKRVVSSTGALEFDEVPRRLVIIGGGIIGVELGSVWRRLGAEVIVIEMMDRICPGFDPRLSKALLEALKRQGMQFHLSTKIASTKLKNDQVRIELAGGQKLEADRLLVSIGRTPSSQNLGLEALGVQLDKGGRIIVDGSFRTNVPSILAIGDLIDGPMLAHKASEEGFAVADLLAGRHAHVNYAMIPSIAYTTPEVASVGLTEDEARKLGLEPKVATSSMAANSRARANGATEGMVMLVADQPTGRLLGMHLMGACAAEMIHVGLMALETKATVEQLARACFGHPTYGESIKEAALALWDRPLHK
jgi:dihydrolipoamide dehydrogenase